MRALAELAVPTTLVLRVEGFEGPVVWTTSRERYAAAGAAGEAAFSPREYEGAVEAAEGGRAARSALGGWARLKAESLGAWRLTAEETGGAVRREAAPGERATWWDGDVAGGWGGHWRRTAAGWTVARALSHFGADLIDVVLEAGEAAA